MRACVGALRHSGACRRRGCGSPGPQSRWRPGRRRWRRRQQTTRRPRASASRPTRSGGRARWCRCRHLLPGRPPWRRRLRVRSHSLETGRSTHERQSTGGRLSRWRRTSRCAPQARRPRQRCPRCCQRGGSLGPKVTHKWSTSPLVICGTWNSRWIRSTDQYSWGLTEASS